MGNKFLSKYPQLWEPCIGDKVVMTSDFIRWENRDTGIIIKVWPGVYGVQLIKTGVKCVVTRKEIDLYFKSHGE